MRGPFFKPMVIIMMLFIKTQRVGNYYSWISVVRFVPSTFVCDVIFVGDTTVGHPVWRRGDGSMWFIVALNMHVAMKNDEIPWENGFVHVVLVEGASTYVTENTDHCIFVIHFCKFGFSSVPVGFFSKTFFCVNFQSNTALLSLNPWRYGSR